MSKGFQGRKNKDRVTPNMRKQGVPEEGTPEYFEYLREKYPQYSDKERPLTSWAKAAIAWKVIFNKTHDETAKHFDVSRHSFERYWRSDEGKEWRERIDEMASDPEKVARLVMQSESLTFAIDLMTLYHTAKDMGDVRTAHKIAKDILDYSGVKPEPQRRDQGDGQPFQINITLSGSKDDFTAIPEAEFDYVAIESAESFDE